MSTLSVTRSVMVSAPRESVRLYLQDVRNAAQYEEKVDAVSVEGSQAVASGRFLGLSWRATFAVEPTPDGGYRAEMTSGSLKRMVCSYSLRAVSGGTILTHEESYQFSFFARPVMRLFRGWLGHTMELELGVIKEEAERLNRRLQLQRIESLG